MDIVQLMTNKFSILTPREGARQVRKDLSLSANWGSHNAVRVLLKIQSKTRQIIRLNNVNVIHLLLNIKGIFRSRQMHKLLPVEECIKVRLTETCLSVFKLYSIQHST